MGWLLNLSGCSVEIGHKIEVAHATHVPSCQVGSERGRVAERLGDAERQAGESVSESLGDEREVANTTPGPSHFPIP